MLIIALYILISSVNVLATFILLIVMHGIVMVVIVILIMMAY